MRNAAASAATRLFRPGFGIFMLTHFQEKLSGKVKYMTDSALRESQRANLNSLAKEMEKVFPGSSSGRLWSWIFDHLPGEERDGRKLSPAVPPRFGGTSILGRWNAYLDIVEKGSWPALYRSMMGAILNAGEAQRWADTSQALQFGHEERLLWSPATWVLFPYRSRQQHQQLRTSLSVAAEDCPTLPGTII